MKAKLEKIDLTKSLSLEINKFDRHNPCSHLDWHLHTEYEIVYVRNGNGVVRIDHNERKYRDGTLICIAPNIPHMGFGNEDFENHAEVVIQFDEDFIKQKLSVFPELISVLNFLKKSRKGIIFDHSVKEKNASLFEQLPAASSSKKLLLSIEILSNLSHSKDYQYCLDYEIQNAPKDSQRVGQILDYINNNYDSEIRVDFIANQVGLTPNSFCRMFKKVTQKTFLEFVNEYRIQKAELLLKNSDKNISEIMYLSGFNDLSYFAKKFKAYKGVTPSKFQRIHLG